MWTLYGEIAHRYRYRWIHEPVQMEPIYDLLTGQLKGYDKMYRYGDILPPKLLVPCDLKKSIGVPRWYFEIGMPVDENEWEAERYEPQVAPGTSLAIIKALLESGRIRDRLGEPPEGMVEYFPLIIGGMLMRFETHSREMVKVGNFQTGTEEISLCCAEKRKEGRKCYGKYRAPTMRDVEMVRRAFNENKSRQHGFFEKQDQSRDAWDFESRAKDSIRASDRVDIENADDMRQAMTMISENRLMGDGHGLDLFKYKVMPKSDALPKHKHNIGA
jgi:hypothetical protein